jgi:hypothetical protein
MAQAALKAQVAPLLHNEQHVYEETLLTRTPDSLDDLLEMIGAGGNEERTLESIYKNRG